MGIDAGNAEHEDTGDDEDDVECGEAGQETVDRTRHLRPGQQ